VKLQDSEKLSEVLKIKLELARMQLERAEKLLNGLSSEQQRWKESYDQNQENLNSLTGNILICAAFIAYLPSFTYHYRSQMLDKWVHMFIERSIPTSKDFNLEK
jgi:dynein heavy chain